MTKIISVLLLLMSFAGCVTSDSPTGIASDMGTGFFPLKTGDTWYYTRYWHGGQSDTTMVTHIAAVIGTRVINARECSIVLHRYFQGGSDSTWNTDTSFYVVQTDSLMSTYKDTAGYHFVVDAIFSLNKGDAFERDFGIGNNSVQYNVTVSEKNDSIMTFFYDSPQIIDEEHQVTYKKGAGIVDNYSTAWGIGEKLIRVELR